MDKKYIIIIVIAIILALAIGFFAFSQFSNEKKELYPFDNKFMSGKFVDKANKVSLENNTTNQWFISYMDDVNKIEYNMSTCKNATFLIEYLKLQGLTGPETRTFNGVEWNIYTSQAVPNNPNSTNETTNETTNNTTKNPSNKVFNIFICEANQNNQSYLIYVTYATFGNNSKIQVDQSIYCDLFIQYIEPLLTSIKFKSNPDAPEVYDLLGISQQDYNKANEQLAELKKSQFVGEQSNNTTK